MNLKAMNLKKGLKRLNKTTNHIILLWLSVSPENMDMSLITNVCFGQISINDYQSRFLPGGSKKVYNLSTLSFNRIYFLLLKGRKQRGPCSALPNKLPALREIVSVILAGSGALGSKNMSEQNLIDSTIQGLLHIKMALKENGGFRI